VRVLVLGPADSPLVDRIQSGGDLVTVTAEPLGPEEARGHEILVSHGYRHILRAPVLDLFPDRAVNLHISLLPWNRGAHPNVWSAVEGTPSGVTVHHIDEGVDTGDVVAQREVPVGDDETLSSSYGRLQEEIVELFWGCWPEVRAGTAPRRSQAGEGSEHRVRDLEEIGHLLSDGWDTRVGALRAAGRERGGGA
jgi:methionyl-tRNA formyltransferase